MFGKQAQVVCVSSPYITPGYVQYRACVCLLGFRDGLTTLLDLPTPNLTQTE